MSFRYGIHAYVNALGPKKSRQSSLAQPNPSSRDELRSQYLNCTFELNDKDVAVMLRAEMTAPLDGATKMRLEDLSVPSNEVHIDTR